MKYIQLTKGKTTVVDDSDYEYLCQYTWHYDGVYASNGKSRRLHKVLMPDKGKYVDHINGDPLDNRRVNLRYCTNAENIRNSKKKSTNTSGHVGVWWKESRQRWCAEIKFNYKKIHIGTFKNIEDAIEARLKKEKELFKEFAREDKNT